MGLQSHQLLHSSPFNSVYGKLTCARHQLNTLTVPSFSPHSQVPHCHWSNLRRGKGMPNAEFKLQSPACKSGALPTVWCTRLTYSFGNHTIAYLLLSKITSVPGQYYQRCSKITSVPGQYYQRCFIHHAKHFCLYKLYRVKPHSCAFSKYSHSSHVYES